MQSSDHMRPPDADAAAANAEPQKPEAARPLPESDVEALSETEPRPETTRPLRRYFEPTSGVDITPADVGHAVNYEVPIESVAPPSAAELPHAGPVSVEPWPDPSPPVFDELPARAGEEARAPEGIADPAAVEPPPASEVAVALPAYVEPEPSQPPPAPGFEPSPFAVPAPRAAAPPSFERAHVAPAGDVVQAAEPVAPSNEAESADAEWQTPMREPEPPRQAAPAHALEPPPATLQHDVTAAWSPAPAVRREPTFARAEPSWHPTQPAAPTVPPPLEATARDYRDLFRRSVRVAVLAFCGWFIAVLLLIVAYRFINPPFSMLMAQQFLTGTAIHNQWVPIGRISPNLTRAVIVAEDGRFCEHWGVDFIEVANAIRRASDGYPRGASTITMQVAKNLFLVNTKSYLRKMVEIPLTFAIELAWPKWRILEIYLNVVEWGPGVFGAEAAAQSHFGRSAAGLTARQAAQLAVSLPNPIVRDAGSPGPRTAHRASVIQARAARTRGASACIDRAR